MNKKKQKNYPALLRMSEFQDPMMPLPDKLQEKLSSDHRVPTSQTRSVHRSSSSSSLGDGCGLQRDVERCWINLSAMIARHVENPECRKWCLGRLMDLVGHTGCEIPPDTIEYFEDHFLPNVKVMAHPLAGANVDRWVEVVTWWEHQKQRG